MNQIKVELPAKFRTVVGKKVKNLRQRGEMPAVVYGHGVKPLNISLEQGVFEKTFKQAGTSTLVDLVIDDQKPMKVLIHEPQPHYLTLKPVHVDFYAVKMDEEIETGIPLHFEGISPAVDELEGNFVTTRSELDVRCLPDKLVSEFIVDISVLKTFDDQIRVKDIALPEGMEVLNDPDEVIALVSAPITEEQLAEDLASDTTEAETAVLDEMNKEPEVDTEASGDKKA